MKGFAMKKIGEAGWVEKERPTCGPLDAIVAPLALSPCTSDIHTVYEGGIGERYDAILGHEGCGKIVEVGELVEDFKVGDEVIISAVTPDWRTVHSQAGHSQHSQGMLSGYKWTNLKDGHFAEYIHVNDADGNLALIPEGISYAEACMLSDMVPTGFHGVELADIQFGDTVLIVGIGPVGLMSVAAAKLRGASQIICVGTRQVCIDAAKQYGATDFVSYKEGPIDEQVMKLTNGEGVDKAVIAGGNTDIFIPVIKVLKAGGKIGNVNYFSGAEFIQIPLADWGAGMAHKTIKGGLMEGGRNKTEKLAKLIQYGRLDVKPLITHTMNGFEKVEDAVQLMKDKPADLIKPVVIL